MQRNVKDITFNKIRIRKLSPLWYAFHALSILVFCLFPAMMAWAMFNIC